MDAIGFGHRYLLKRKENLRASIGVRMSVKIEGNGGVTHREFYRDIPDRFRVHFRRRSDRCSLRKALPERHLAEDTKDVVRLGTGLIGTIAALVLGLLTASASGSYQTQSGHVQHMTADIILLDDLLAQYGPEAQPARELLRRAVGVIVERIWRENSSASATQVPFRATAAGEEAFAKIQQLPAQSEDQRLLKSRAVELTVGVAQTRLLLLEQGGSSIPTPFLAVLIFWLSMIFASFGLFSRLNPVAAGVLFIC